MVSWSLVARGYDRPVNDAPHILDVIGTAVLVAQVVSMLPNVDTHERTKSVYDRVAPVGLLRDN